MRCTFAIVSMTLLLWPTSARAQADEVVAEVSAYDARAEEYFAAGDFAAALAEQEAAQALLPATPRLFNMAVCLERLDRPREAMDLYRQFVVAPDVPSERRQLAQQRIDAIQVQLAEPERPPIEFGSGEAVDEESEDVAAIDEDPTPTPEPVPVTAPADRSGRNLSPVAFWTMLGLTGAAGLATIICGAVTLDMHDEFLSTYQGEGDSRDLQVSGRNLSMVTNIFIGVTAAFAASALVLGLVTNWDDGEEDSDGVALVPSVGPGGASLSLEGRF